MDAGRGQPRDHGPLEHAGDMVRVAVHGNHATAGQGRPVRGAQLGGELGGEVDVDHAGDPKAPEEVAAALRAPDQTGREGGPRLDLFIGPDLDARLDHGALADDRVIADDDTFKDHRPALDAHLAAENGAAHLGPLADVAIAPDDAAVDDRPVVDNRVVADDGRALDGHPFFDLDPRREINRPVQMG